MKRKIKVLVVDDSFFMRKLISGVLCEDPSIEVVGNARDGIEAIELLNNLKPDVVTLDYEMPRMNGLETLENIMKSTPVPCIMLSAYTFENAELTMEALSKGAFDFVPKPSGEVSLDIIKIGGLLINKVKSAYKVSAQNLNPTFEQVDGTKPKDKRFDAVSIASSTGGPQLIEYIITNMPLETVPFFIVQHMPCIFTDRFARRLTQTTGKRVKESKDGEVVRPGTFYIAKGGIHLTLKDENKQVIVVHNDAPPRHGVKPSADYLFESMAKIYGSRSLSIILSGMGKDGSEGVKHIKQKGGKVWVQNKSTALIWSMPKAALDTGGVDCVLSPREIVEGLLQSIQE